MASEPRWFVEGDDAYWQVTGRGWMVVAYPLTDRVLEVHMMAPGESRSFRLSDDQAPGLAAILLEWHRAVETTRAKGGKV